jgi:tellurite resistance protein TerC
MRPANHQPQTVLNEALRHARRLLIFVVGSTLLLLGVVMLVTPGPGWLFIFGGLSVLGIEFVWARRLLRKAKTTANNARRKLLGSNHSDRG